MNKTKVAEIKALTVEERIRLVEEIWNSIAENPDLLDVPDWHRSELDRRLASHRDAPDTGTPWPGVKRRILDQS